MGMRTIDRECFRRRRGRTSSIWRRRLRGMDAADREGEDGTRWRVFFTLPVATFFTASHFPVD